MTWGRSRPRPQSDLRGRSRSRPQISFLNHSNDLVFCAKRRAKRATLPGLRGRQLIALFTVSKNHRRKHFSRLGHKLQLAQWLEVVRGRDLNPTSEAIQGWKLQKSWFYSVWRLITSFAILLILMAELKVCGWRVSARGSGERSEPAAGRPRKEQAPKAPSRIASCTISTFPEKYLNEYVDFKRYLKKNFTFVRARVM